MCCLGENVTAAYLEMFLRQTKNYRKIHHRKPSSSKIFTTRVKCYATGKKYRENLRKIASRKIMDN